VTGAHDKSKGLRKEGRFDHVLRPCWLDEIQQLGESFGGEEDGGDHGVLR
jgi:hypothetical protein